MSTGKVLGSNRVSEVLPELVVTFAAETFDGRFLNDPVHPLDLIVGSWMVWFGEPMPNFVQTTIRSRAYILGNFEGFPR